MSEPPHILFRLLRSSVERYADRTALISGDLRLSYRQLSELVDSYTKSLVAIGVGKGTRVGLLMENRIEWVAFVFAATGLGALFVPISTFSKRDDLAFTLKHGDISCLFMSAKFLNADYFQAIREMVPEIATASPGQIYSEALPSLRRVVVAGAESLPAAVQSWDSFVVAGNAVPDAVIAGLREQVDPQDDCYLLYTSGTTAVPKGVLQVQSAVARNGQLIGEYQQLSPEDIVWFYFPMFFSAGCINVLLGTLSQGAALILQAIFDPGEALELIEKEQATTWHLWPHTLKQMQEHPDWQTRDHSRLHKGTGPWDVLLGREAPDGLGGVSMYGMTETCTAFTCTLASDNADIRLNTTGTLMPGNEMKIIDPDTGFPLPTGEQGEVCVKGPSVMRRYYKLDPADHFDEEGYFHTGDLGFFDVDGHFHFLQRIKDMIKTGGINVSPADIEVKLAQLEGVKDAYAFPLPNADKGEVVGAALVMREGARLSDQQVLDHCREALPGFKRPHAILVMTSDNVPMTGSGKVQKNQLAQRLQEEYVPGGDTIVHSGTGSQD